MITESNIKTLKKYFPGWSSADIKDHIAIVNNMGISALQRRIKIGELLLEKINEPGIAPKEYDDYRISFGMISCFRTISRKWKDMPEILRNESGGDKEIYKILFM